MGRAFEYRRASKEKRWDKMSKVFPKLARSITMAAKSSGPDPETNSALRTAISNAKAENMPKDNIDKAIKRAQGKDGALYNEVNYEAKGPHGSLLFIETTTDNTNRTVANLKMILNNIPLCTFSKNRRLFIGAEVQYMPMLGYSGFFLFSINV